MHLQRRKGRLWMTAFMLDQFSQNIMDIILRFRIHKMALAGDIDKVFLMVSMAEKDWDVATEIFMDRWHC